MSINWQLDAEPAPAILVLPPAAASLDEAHAAIELWEHYSRKTLDPTQRLAVEVMMAQDSSGRWAAATTGREMARQNGKGDEIEVVELWGLVQRSEAILHTIHDAVLLSSQTQQRMLGVLESHADLRRLKKRQWLGTGQQMIEMRNGGIIWYRTRTGGGGRGVDDVDRIVIDEAQHATEEHLAAVAPTMLANSNPQLNAMGTAGLAGKSEWWWTLRIRALSGDPGAFGYVGHTAEKVSLDDEGRPVQEPVDVSDMSLRRGSNPVLDRDPSKWEFLEEQFRRLGPESFAREHLCVWDPPEGVAGASVFPAGAWQDCAGESSMTGQPQFGVAVAEDRTWAAIGVAGRSGSAVQGELAEYRPGTEWVAKRVVELKVAWGGRFGVVKGSPAASLVEGMKKAGLSEDDIVEVSPDENARHCGQLFDAVAGGTFVHRNEGALNTAVKAAERRPFGDAWVWSQRKSKKDISPLVAVTTAVGLHGLGAVEMALPDVVLI